MACADPLIAVVDDEPPVRTMLRRLLRLADYQVAAFESGQAFLDQLATMVPLPACAIVDIHMPGLSGLDLQAHLRAVQIHVPIVLITASDDAALDRTALQAGAVRLLRKPFSNDALLEAVSLALGGRCGERT